MILEIINEGIPLVNKPYDEIGKKLGLGEKEVVSRIEKLKDEGAIRKIAAFIRPRGVGIKENAMTVWVVPEAKIEEVGNKMAQFAEVTHCYQRPAIPGKWPYTLFCMVHQPTKKACEEIAKRISDAVGIKDYRLLYSTKGSHPR